MCHYWYRRKVLIESLDAVALLSNALVEGLRYTVDMVPIYSATRVQRRATVLRDNFARITVR